MLPGNKFTKKESLYGKEWTKRVMKGEKDVYVGYSPSLRRRKNTEYICKFEKWLQYE